jgi:hypothetical protein
MFTVLKPSWFDLILIGVVAILAIMLYFGSCNKPIKAPDTHRADSTALKAVADLKAERRLRDSLAGIAGYWHSKYDSTFDVVQKGLKIISMKESKIRALMDSNAYFKSINDTLSQLTNCGDLMDQVDQLLTIIDQGKVAIDSMKVASDSLLNSKDQIINIQRQQLLSLEGQLLSVKADYDLLVHQNKKTINRLKFEDIIAKVGTIAAAILSITVLIKK